MPSRPIPPRLTRLLADDGRCVLGMFDNGHFGEPAWSSLAGLVGRLVGDPENRAFDGLSIPRASAGALQSLPGRERPALVLRADFSDFWLGGWFGNRAPARAGASVSTPLAGAVETALRLDAAAVITTLIRSTTDPGLQTACLRTVDQVRATCDRWGMPVLIETAAFVEEDGALVGDFSLETQATLAWQAAELGADLIKTDPTLAPADFAAVVAAAAGSPVLAGSGPKGSEDEIKARTGELVAAGAAGVGYGGNFTRAADPFAMAREISAIVHSESAGSSAQKGAR